MKRYTSLIITLIGENGDTILEKKLNHLPIKDDYVIAKSIEFFNDPEPCMIHRSAVLDRIFMEYMEYFEKLLINGELIRHELPESLRQILDIETAVKYLSIKQSRSQ